MKKKNSIKKINSKFLYGIIILFLLIFISIFIFSLKDKSNLAIIKTSYGDITIELYEKVSPITVKNFKKYIKEDFYDGTIFHRVMKDFMIQGGGFNTEGIQKQTNPPIILESNNGLSNDKYTIAMARTLKPNSATSQFFINTNDNTFLNYGVRDEGYAVFGKVIDGFEVVDKINAVQTTSKNRMTDWPVKDIIIYSIELV